MGTVVFILVGAIVSQILLLVPYLTTEVSGTLEPTFMGLTMTWMGVIECLSFAILYEGIHKALPQKGIKKGLIYGLIIWYINIFLTFLGSYNFTLTTLQDSLFVGILKLAMIPAYGITLEWVHMRLSRQEE